MIRREDKQKCQINTFNVCKSVWVAIVVLWEAPRPHLVLQTGPPGTTLIRGSR